MADGFTKRTTFIVADAANAAQFYCDVFGMTVWYDNELAVDGRFPPCMPDMSHARLVIVQARDPKIGMLGFLSYVSERPKNTPGFEDRDRLRLGDTVLVFEVDDLDEIYARVQRTGARIVSPPARWVVPGPSGGEIELYSMSLFDGQGIYMEVGQRRTNQR